MAKAIAVREADPRELAEVEDLVRLAYEEFREYFPDTAWSAWMDNIGRTVQSETGVVLVATESGKIRGVVKFYPDAGQAGLGQWPPGVASIRIWRFIPPVGAKGWVGSWCESVLTGPGP